MPIHLIILVIIVIIAAPIVLTLIFQSGNPFGHKMNSSKIHLKKEETLKVKAKSGRWKCPSCGDTNLEIKKDCGSCGQKIDKS